MLQRFVAGTAVAAVAIAFGAIVVLLAMPALTLQKIYLIPIFWCFAPFVWGVWAMLTPATWLPQRLPLWGAILGFFAVIMAAFVLNVPAIVLGSPVPVAARMVAVVVAIVFYYLMWMLVRAVYRSLTGTPAPRAMSAKA